MHLGPSSSITAFCDNYVVVHHFSNPLVVTCILSHEASLGAVYSFLPQLQTALQPLHSVIDV